ncbi:hypothetical protein ACI2L4_01110 [Streptomyces sparsogenes]|uniref:hypothetical protein n=1 Tax=Streptomyces sparsogenes TaxID=67365 RepID=UPI0033C88B0C
MHDNDDLLYLPWGEVTPEFWIGSAAPQAAPEPAAAPARPEPMPEGSQPLAQDGDVDRLVGPLPLPDEYHDQLAAATEAMDNGRLTDAEEIARTLEQRITTAYGEQHEYTANVREMQAHIAHLSGDHAAATRIYLGVAHFRAEARGASDPLTRASAHRAMATWQAIADPSETRKLADSVVAMLSEFTGESSSATRNARAHLARQSTPQSRTGRNDSSGVARVADEQGC